ncbi:hypothetical protein, partial [Escherichia coli]|uniref:hypothetical protein n=1 Tax=Escherichia coli TaxID=562 RepID=UPI00244AE764
ILLRQKQKKLIMLPSETMIWQPEFTDKTLSRKPGAVHSAEMTALRKQARQLGDNTAASAVSTPRLLAVFRHF